MIDNLGVKMQEKVATIFLVDGEHHPSTVKDAVRELEEREGCLPLALYFLGGHEKLRDISEPASITAGISKSNLV